MLQGAASFHEYHGEYDMLPSLLLPTLLVLPGQSLDAEIDRPTPQVRVEVVLVSVALADLQRGSPEPAAQWQTLTPRVPGRVSLQVGDAEFHAELQRLRDQGLATLQANPQVLAASGRPARFHCGGSVRVPVLQDAQGASAGDSLVEYGTSLEATPTVLDDGRIHVQYHLSVIRLDDSRGVTVPGWGKVPGRVGPTFSNVVTLLDGQTLVQGGYVQSREHAVVTKVPLLGDLPLVGPWFQKTRSETVEEELLLLVTAQIVQPEGP